MLYAFMDGNRSSDSWTTGYRLIRFLHKIKVMVIDIMISSMVCAPLYDSAFLFRSFLFCSYLNVRKPNSVDTVSKHKYFKMSKIIPCRLACETKDVCIFICILWIFLYFCSLIIQKEIISFSCTSREKNLLGPKQFSTYNNLIL